MQTCSRNLEILSHIASGCLRVLWHMFSSYGTNMQACHLAILRESLMSPQLTRHCTHVNESWWTSHVTRVKKSRHTCENIASADKTRHTCEYVMAHMWTCHVTHVNNLRHTRERVMVPICRLVIAILKYRTTSPQIKRQGKHIFKSWHTCEQVMALMRTCHVTHVNKLWHTRERVMVPICRLVIAILRCRTISPYRVAKTHRIPYLYTSLSAKVTYI